MDENRSFSATGLVRDPNAPVTAWNMSNRAPRAPFQAAEPPETVIGENVSIKGELAYPISMRIDGNFEGTLNSTGKLHVGPKGKVTCDLNLKSAIIEGEVIGNLKIEGHVKLCSSAKITGDITAESLVVEEGAQLNGIVSIQPKK